MKIWRFHEFGPIENLVLEDIPTPDPAEDEALIRLHCAAINPADRFLVAKKYPRPGTPPLAVGRDGAGVIVSAPSTSGFQAGDRVMLLRSDVGVTRDGTLAEYVTVPVDCIAPIPEGWTDEEAAAGGLVQLTAWQALVEEGGLSIDGADDKIVLISGASGGVGTAALLQAKALGARVVALSRSEDKRKELEELGADWTFDSERPDLADAIKSALGKQRVDVVVDNLAGPYMDTYIAVTGFKGRICTVGMLAGVETHFNIGKMIFKRIHIVGIAVGSQTARQARSNWDQIVQVFKRNDTRPLVDRVFDFSQVLEAFEHLASGPMGKVVVKMPEE